MTGLIGYPLVALNFAQQRYEANFRFSLARLREYAEQIALLAGERTEKASLKTRFGAIVINYFRLSPAVKTCRRNIDLWSGQRDHPLPHRGTLLFAGKVTLGIMMQTARGFLSVQSALNFFVTYFVRSRFQSRARPLDVLRSRDRQRKDAGLFAAHGSGHASSAQTSRHRGAQCAASQRP